MTTSYPTDMTDDQWELLQTSLPPAKATGRPRTTDLRIAKFSTPHWKKSD